MDIETHGPIFNPSQAEAILTSLARGIEDQVADEAYNEVMSKLAQVLDKPTGYYESQVTTERAQGDAVVVGDNVVYGPWLEGVGSRNQSTRFKGYHTFRKVAQEIDTRVPEIIEPVVQRHVRRLDG